MSTFKKYLNIIQEMEEGKIENFEIEDFKFKFLNKDFTGKVMIPKDIDKKFKQDDDGHLIMLTKETLTNEQEKKVSVNVFLPNAENAVNLLSDKADEKLKEYFTKNFKEDYKKYKDSFNFEVKRAIS